MAKPKNTGRRKRKYANQAARTERNKANRQKRHERRMARFAKRTEALHNTTVRYGSGTATVVDILYPEKGPKRVLVLEDTDTGQVRERLRKRVKPL